MKLNLSELRKIVRSNLLLEDSEQVFAQFIYDMEELVKRASSFKQETIDDVVANQPPEEQAQVRQRLYKLRDKSHASVLSKYPNVNPEDIKQILTRARQKSDSDGSSYAQNVIDFTRSYWSDNVVSVGSFATADPKNRGTDARSIDNILKQSWKKAASEHPDFWNKFESWHAVGGITGNANSIDASVGLKFYNQNKDGVNTNELSCYGWHGNNPTTNVSLNSGITDIINSNSTWSETKIHFKMLGDITFAASHDILTQWLKLKQEDQEDFVKSGDFTRILSSGTKDIIAGPKDRLLSGQDFYNEIILDNWKIGGYVVLPKAISEKFSTRALDPILRGMQAAASELKIEFDTESMSPIELVQVYQKGKFHYNDGGPQGFLLSTYDVLRDNKSPDEVFQDFSLFKFVQTLIKDGVIIFNTSGNELTNQINLVFKLRSKMIAGFEDRPAVDKLTMDNFVYFDKYKPEILEKIREMIRKNVVTRRGEPIRQYLKKEYGYKIDNMSNIEIANMYIKDEFDRHKDGHALRALSYKDYNGNEYILNSIDNIERAVESYDTGPPIPDDIDDMSLETLKSLPPPKEPENNPGIWWSWLTSLETGKKEWERADAKGMAGWVRQGGSSRGDVLVWDESLPASEQEWQKPRENKNIQAWLNYEDLKRKRKSAIELNENKMYEKILKKLLKI
jgi:hypothetical protein